MESRREYIIKRIKDLGRSILPRNSKLLLYGSQARGDYNEFSDWDMLIILDQEKADRKDFDRYAFPFCMLGAEMQEIISPLIYGKEQWRQMSLSPFSINVHTDKIELC